MRRGVENKKAQRVVRLGESNRPTTTTLDLDSTMNTLMPIIEMFRPAFTAPTYQNFRYLIVAWIQCGQAKISEMLRARRHLAGLYPQQNGEPKHFSVFYDFFTERTWSLDRLGRILAEAFESRLSDEVYILVDDTLFRRTGPQILGGGVYHDPLASTYSGSRGRQTQFSFGLKFVVLAIWVPVGFMQSGGIAVPILFRLYRSPKTCSADDHTKFTVLGAELVGIVEQWWPDRRIVNIGDRDYASQTVLTRVDPETDVVGPLPMDARLRDPEFDQTPGPGRTRKWGARLPSPEELAADESIPWETVQMYMYGGQITVRVKTIQAQWKCAPADRTLTVVVTRDPSGRLDDAAFFRTRPEASIEEVLVPMSLRWALESCFRDGKQHFRLEAIQNGFERGETRADTTEPGPRADPARDPTASRRTVPIGMLAYGIVVLWYLDHGNPIRDIKWARYLAPWYTHKTTISFRDMLQAYRRQMDIEGFFETPSQGRVCEKTPDDFGLDPPSQPSGRRNVA